MKTEDIFRRIYFPYCLKKSENGGYYILNRFYKPLGFFTSENITYEDYPIEVFISITKKMAAKLSWEGSDNTEAIFLYNDGTIPERSKENMDNYMGKLKLLASLKIRKKSNPTTIEAIEEARKGNLVTIGSIDNLLNELNSNKDE